MGSICPHCGATLAPDAPEGLCSACIFQAASEESLHDGVSWAALGAGQTDSLDEGLCLQPGDHFGPYRIERLLGRGGMGDVYAAEHLEQGRRLAIKLLSRRLSGSEDRERFLKEGQLAAAVNHPNSVYVFGSEEIAGIPVIAMELLPGGTLKDRVKQRGRLRIEEAIDAILQVISGLEAAHGSGVLHRDIKPSNCFVDVDQTVKVGDFGLSIPTPPLADSGGVRTNIFQGTPGFASPEQLRGDPLDLRADIYSVGATLYYLLTADTPGGHRGLSALAAGVDVAPVRSPRELRPEIPKQLAALILSCLAPDRTLRPSSYAELAVHLSPFSSAFAVPATLSRRIAARMFDAVILLPIVASCTAVVVLSRLATREYDAVFLGVLLPIAVYQGIGDGLFGTTYGKRRCGLRVVGPYGARPGLLRGLVRTGVFIVPLAVALAIRAMAFAPAWPWAPVAALIVGWLLLSVATSRNRVRGLHDLISGTRVIVMPSRGPALAATGTPESLVPSPHAGRHIGPYLVVASLGATDSGELLLGFDPSLKRQAWIHLRPIGSPVASFASRENGRLSRLRWLNGHQTDLGTWDAYEAPDGGPLTDLPTPGSWQSVRQWLLDLAKELDADLKDQSSGTYSLARLWITRDQRLRVLDFCLPRATDGHVATCESPMSLLQSVMDRSLTTVTATDLPLEVSVIRHHLSRGEFTTPSELAAALSSSLYVNDRVTRKQRSAAASATLLTYLIGAPVATAFSVALLRPIAPSVSPETLAQVAGPIAAMFFGLCWGVLWRGGFWLHAFDIAVVTRDGREASRLRAVARAGTAWSLMLAAAIVAEAGSPLIALGLHFTQLILLAYAIDHPNRGLQDRLVGTYLVPR